MYENTVPLKKHVIDTSTCGWGGGGDIKQGEIVIHPIHSCMFCRFINRQKKRSLMDRLNGCIEYSRMVEA